MKYINNSNSYYMSNIHTKVVLMQVRFNELFFILLFISIQNHEIASFFGHCHDFDVFENAIRKDLI